VTTQSSLPTDSEHDARVRESIESARRAMSRARLTRWTLWSLAVSAGVLSTLFLSVIASGHQAPVAWLLAAGVAAAIGALLGWSVRRPTRVEAAAFLDDACRLEDGASTAAALEGAADGFARKQREWTARRLGDVDASRLRASVSRPLAAAAVVLPAIATLLTAVPESQAVRSAREQAERTAALAEELREGYRQELEKQIENAPEPALEHLDPDALREQAEAIELTDDRKQLLKQFSKAELAVAASASELVDTRRDRLIEEIQRALRDAAETSALAENLKQGRFEEAAAELGEFSPGDREPTERDLPTIGKKLDRLSKLSGRLGESARRFNEAEARPTEEGAGEAEGDWSDQLARDLEELEGAAREANESLGKCEGGSCTPAELDRLAKAMKRSDRALGELAERLREQGGRRQAQRTLGELRRSLAQCQSAAAGLAPSPFTGGQKAGVGSSLVENEDPTPEGGELTGLSGVQGEGPSRRRTLEAVSADARSAARRTGDEVEYARQLESFIDREDIPWELREGVKTYFETLNKASPIDAGEPNGEQR